MCRPKFLQTYLTVQRTASEGKGSETRHLLFCWRSWPCCRPWDVAGHREPRYSSNSQSLEYQRVVCLLRLCQMLAACAGQADWPRNETGGPFHSADTAAAEGTGARGMPP